MPKIPGIQTLYRTIKNALVIMWEKEAVIVKFVLLKPCRMNQSLAHFIYRHNPSFPLLLVCQIMQLPAKHFLPLTHSLKQLAAIISRSDQRQRHGRVTPSVHNQRTICFKGQGGRCQEEESLGYSPALNVILSKKNKKKCSYRSHFFLN